MEVFNAVKVIADRFAPVTRFIAAGVPTLPVTGDTKDYFDKPVIDGLITSDMTEGVFWHNHTQLMYVITDHVISLRLATEEEAL